MSMSIARQLGYKLRDRVGSCPITHGRKSKITAKGKKRLCAAYLSGKKSATYNYKSGGCGDVPGRCLVCKGNDPPPELKIVNMEEMMTQTTKKKCDICGKNKQNLGRNHGVNACASCRDLQAHVSRRPELVASVMTMMHGDKYFQPAPLPDPGPIDLVNKIKAALGLTAHDKIISEIERRNQQLEDLNTANTDLAAQLMEREHEIEDLSVTVQESQQQKNNVLSSCELKAYPSETIPVLRLLTNNRLLSAVNVMADELSGTGAVRFP